MPDESTNQNVSSEDQSNLPKTQEDLNKIIQDRLERDRKSRGEEITPLKDQLEEYKKKLQEEQKKVNLTEDQRKENDKKIKALNDQLQSKEGDIKDQISKLTKEYNDDLESKEKQTAYWQKNFEDEFISNSILQNFGKNAYDPNQVLGLVKPMAKIEEVVDKSTGEKTGKYRVVIPMNIKNKDGKEEIKELEPKEAADHFYSLNPNLDKNQIKGNGSPFIGGSSDGSNNIANMTSAEKIAQGFSNRR